MENFSWKETNTQNENTTIHLLCPHFFHFFYVYEFASHRSWNVKKSTSPNQKLLRSADGMNKYESDFRNKILTQN